MIKLLKSAAPMSITSVPRETSIRCCQYAWTTQETSHFFDSSAKLSGFMIKYWMSEILNYLLHSVTAGAVLQTIRITVKCLHEETQNILLSCINNETWFSFIVFRLSSLNWSAKTCWNSNFDTAYWWFMMNINMLLKILIWIEF